VRVHASGEGKLPYPTFIPLVDKAWESLT
jgi:hypothetical protein